MSAILAADLLAADPIESAVPDYLPVRSAYDLWAPTYDTDVNATRDLDGAVLRATALPLDGASVIEFGAGTGKNTVYLASRARKVVALDLSEGMLAVARRRIISPHVRFVVHDVTHPWPVPDGSADVVVGNLVLEHVADLAPVFEAARLALRAGGLLTLCELHPYRQWRGGGARFTGEAGECWVNANIHATSEYVNAGIDAGFRLRRLHEIADPKREADSASPLPRLLQLVFAA